MTASLIGGGKKSTWRKPQTDLLQVTDKLYHITLTCIEYTSLWAGFQLTTLMVIGTDWIGSCKSNYHTIMTLTSFYYGPLNWFSSVEFANCNYIISHNIHCRVCTCQPVDCHLTLTSFLYFIDLVENEPSFVDCVHFFVTMQAMTWTSYEFKKNHLKLIPKNSRNFKYEIDTSKMYFD